MKNQNQNEIYNMIFQEDDLKWQSLIYEMIRTGKINPWDIDVSMFANEYLKMIDLAKQMNFRISGKVVLTAAILLRMKTNRLGLNEFLGMIEEPEEDIEPGLEDFDSEPSEMESRIGQLAEKIKSQKRVVLDPRIDRQKERKVTVFELMTALKKAMEVDERRKHRHSVKAKEAEDQPEFKFKKFDIMGKIKRVYDTLITFFRKTSSSTVEFSQIIPSKNKTDIVWTFVPLLHLANEGKVELIQDEPFGKIHVALIDKELLSNAKE